MMWVLKQIGPPGSIPLLVLCLCAGLLLRFLRPRSARLAYGWLLAVGISYLVLSLPLIANGIAARLPAVPDAGSPTSPGPVDMLVVLDGDNRRGRARAGIQVNAAAAPREIWVLGNGWLVEELSAGGVPRNRIWHEAFLGTTREQMATLQRLVSQRPGARVAVIVSRFQAPRIAALLDAMHLRAVELISSPADAEPPVSGALSFVPTYYALRISRDALYEHAALWYYRRNHWIG